jgi:Tfp pilus assembly protein PilV
MSPQRNLSRTTSDHNAAGFSLMECVIALVLLMVGSLAIVAVMNFSMRSNADARKRYAALQLAQQRSEDVRNTVYSSLTAGTTTENGVVFDGTLFKVVRLIEDNDTLTVATAPGPETKKITITVSTVSNPMIADTVSVVTYRSNNRPGPNKSPNPTP